MTWYIYTQEPPPKKYGTNELPRFRTTYYTLPKRLHILSRIVMLRLLNISSHCYAPLHFDVIARPRSGDQFGSATWGRERCVRVPLCSASTCREMKRIRPIRFFCRTIAHLLGHRARALAVLDVGHDEWDISAHNAKHFLDVAPQKEFHCTICNAELVTSHPACLVARVQNRSLQVSSVELDDLKMKPNRTNPDAAATIPMHSKDIKRIRFVQLT
jgi:hypothetical protein